MRRIRSQALVVAVRVMLASGAFVLTGCPEKGPAEKAGEKVDETVDKVKEAVDPSGPAEKAGEKIDEALGND